MPYVDDKAKEQAFQDLKQGRGAADAGSLTYEFQQTILEYLYRHGLRYQQIDEISGALHQVSRDFDERIVQPYEAKKRRENGDVWPTCFQSLPERPA